MTAGNTSPTIAASVVSIVKQVWYLVLTVVTVHIAFHIFRWHFYHPPQKTGLVMGRRWWADTGLGCAGPAGLINF